MRTLCQQPAQIKLALCCRWLLLLKGSLAPIAGLDASASAMHAYAVSASDAALDATQMYLRLLQVPLRSRTT